MHAASLKGPAVSPDCLAFHRSSVSNTKVFSDCVGGLRGRPAWLGWEFTQQYTANWDGAGNTLEIVPK